MLEEQINFLPREGTIFRDDIKTVFMMISKAVADKYVESKIKSYPRRKYGRAAFLLLFQTTLMILNIDQ